MFCVVAGMSLEEVREFEKQLQQETNQKMKDNMSNSGSISKQEKKDLGGLRVTVIEKRECLRIREKIWRK